MGLGLIACQMIMGEDEDLVPATRKRHLGSGPLVERVPATYPRESAVAGVPLSFHTGR